MLKNLRRRETYQIKHIFCSHIHDHNRQQLPGYAIQCTPHDRLKGLSQRNHRHLKTYQRADAEASDRANCNLDQGCESQANSRVHGVHASHGPSDISEKGSVRKVQKRGDCRKAFFP